MDESKLKMISIGVAGANLALDSDMLEVAPMEHIPMADGEITDNATQSVVSYKNKDGTPFQVGAYSTNTVKAKWRDFGGSNRATPPNVRRGEKVNLYQYADSDEYYWEPHGDGAPLRKLETVVYNYSGTADEKAKTDNTNSYFFEVSTHAGLISLHTSKANNEPFGYDIQINAAAGTIHIQDDAGNVIYMNSKEKQIELTNGDQSSIVIDKKDITHTCAGTFKVQAQNIQLNATDTQVTSSTVEVNGSGSVNITGGEVSIN